MWIELKMYEVVFGYRILVLRSEVLIGLGGWLGLRGLMSGLGVCGVFLGVVWGVGVWGLGLGLGSWAWFLGLVPGLGSWARFLTLSLVWVCWLGSWVG